MLATRGGLVKKTRLTEYDTNRTGGVIAINLREGDELVSARLVDADDDLLLVSRKGMSVRFTRRRRGAAADGPGDLRRHRHAVPRRRRAARHGRRTARLVVVTVTDGGFAKRTALEEWTAKGRGSLGVRAMQPRRGAWRPCRRHGLRSRRDLRHRHQRGGDPHAGRRGPATGRDTMGVSLMDLAEGVTVVAVARAEAEDDVDDDDAVRMPR